LIHPDMGETYLAELSAMYTICLTESWATAHGLEYWMDWRLGKMLLGPVICVTDRTH
jgi:hypothetical protein